VKGLERVTLLMLVLAVGAVVAQVVSLQAGWQVDWRAVFSPKS